MLKVCQTPLAYVTILAHNTLPVASSGIAALLLRGGRTAHSRFKIPVDGLCETSTCIVHAQKELADLLRAAHLIVWDEAPMLHKHGFEAVNRTLQDIVGAPGQVFGGKVVVMGGGTSGSCYPWCQGGAGGRSSGQR
jgi:hypothetical protein